jgi:signal transduction histidine kinase
MMEQPRTKILLAGGFVALLVLMGVLTVMGGAVLTALYEDIDAEAHSAEKIRMVYAMRKAVWQRNLSILRSQNLDDFFNRDEERQRFNSYARDFILARNRYIEMGLEIEEKATFDFLSAQIREMRPHVERAMQLAYEGKDPNAITAASELATLVQSAMLKTLDRMVDFQEYIGEQRSLEIKGRRDKTNTLLFAIAVTVFILGLFISVFVFQRETRQTNSLFREISERKLAEASVMVSKEEADIANRAKSEFLANMSHELRTPLNSILGFSEILESESFGPHQNPKYKDYAASIHQAGSHLLNILSDILDISKIEAGEAQVEDTEVDVTQALDSCVTMVTPRAVAAGVNIRVNGLDIKPFLRADERQFKQIFLNLLSNAVKFTEKGGLVTVTTNQDESGGKVIVITDTGISIAAKDIPKVMSPFGQAASSLDRNHDGTGLGLPICKSLLDLHGADLNIESEVGKGSTITVSFPSERTVHKT